MISYTLFSPFKTLLGSLTLCFLFFSQTCRLTQPIVPDLSKLDPVIEMEKGPCYGNCPVYQLTIYTDRTATFRGERFTNKNGLWTKKLALAEYDRLVQAFREANLWKYPSAYKSNIPDLQTVTLRYYEEDRSKEVIGKDGRPESILALEEMAERVANSGGWYQIEAGDGEPAPASNNNGTTAQNSELIVELADGVDPQVWIIQFARQEMRVVKKISPRNAYYVVSFNPEITAPEEMLNLVRRSPYVLGAQYNRQTENRDGF